MLALKLERTENKADFERQLDISGRVTNLYNKIRAHKIWDEEYLYNFTMGLMEDPSDLADWEACFDAEPVLKIVK